MTDEPTMLLSDRKAAAFLGVSEATLWRGSKDGRYPGP
jgi:predicted DNA-binding transcriptional regulator AlpA